MTATYGANNSVIISGYWGDTDASKKLVVNVGNQTFNVDMSGVIGQNFTVTIPGSCIGTNFTGITFYHQDYPSAARTIAANLPITATAADVNVTYDGAAHGITPVVTVPANNYTIKYGTSYGGCSSSSSPTYINAGDYTVYYQVSAEHYSTFIGSATVSISKAASSVVTPPTPGVGMEYLNSNISLLTTGGTASGGNMVYALGTNATTPTTSGYSTNIPTGKSWGNYYVWYKVQGDANHNDSDPGVVVASIAEPPTYAVTVSVRETGLGSVGINNNYNVSSANIHAHDNVTINATPASGLSFVRWTDGNGSQKSTSNNYNATITEAIDFVADFGYNVSVTKIGNGTIQMNYTDIDNVSQTTGEVTNNTQRYTHSGSEVTLTATPDAHYHFKYWTNNLNDQKVTTNTFTFAPSATVTYTAVFAVDTHNVTIAANDLTKGGVFVKQVVLTEGFESGNMPDGWTSNEYEWTVVSANGQTGTYCIKNGNSGNRSTTSTLSVSINFVGEGSISFRSRVSSESNWDVGRFIIDDVEKFFRSGPEEGWREDNYVVPAGTHTFAWSYSKDGSVNSNDDAFYVDDIVIKDFASASTEPYRYTYGQTCDILAVPEEYCYFENWTDENDHVVGTAASKSFTVTGDTTLAANFAINSYTITATANPMAAGTITGAGNYNHNAPCSLTASPATGYHFVNWTEGETVVSTDATYNFTVTGARTLTANFQLNSYTITFNSNGGSAVASITQDYGTSVIAPANPTRTGYTFAGWDPVVPATMPAENTECNATWTPINYILTDIPDGWTVTANGQTVTPNNGEASIPSGATVVLTPPDSLKPRVKDVELLTPEQIPLTFEAKTAGATVTFGSIYSYGPESISVEYSKNGGAWETYTEPITLTNVGDKVSFRGNNTTYYYNYQNYHFSCSEDCYLYGNIMSLVDSTGYADAKTLTSDYAFQKLFYDNTHIVNHPSKTLILPATTLTNKCYSEMFSGCTGLTSAPELPAATLAFSCYSEMFYGCTSLTTAPALPASTLVSSCYNGMFYDCTSLTTAPALPATTMASSCYFQMFRGCTSLTNAPALPATTLDNSCYDRMFYDCTSLATAPELPANTLKNYCYQYMFYGCTNLTTAPELPANTLKDYCYSNMFYGCTGLTSAPELPATTLAIHCYNHMFNGCTSLTAAPELPATLLENACYQNMFSGCTSLTTAPELPATTLVDNCYYRMFSGCTGLTAAPNLPATTMKYDCYYGMFSGCTSLTTAPNLPATTLAYQCYGYMFNGCTGLTTAPNLPAATLWDYCYQSMFYGCINLNSVTCLATNISANGCTMNWLYGVATLGTFTKAESTDWSGKTGANGIPSGWTTISVTP